jgi:hypothetical protein
VLGRPHQCDPAQILLQLSNGTEDLLDGFYRARPGRRFHTADLVGIGGDFTHPLHFVVGGLPQRLVLTARLSLTFLSS